MALGRDLEASAGPVLAPADGQLVSCRMPEQCYLEAVVGAMGSFPGARISLEQRLVGALFGRPFTGAR